MSRPYPLRGEDGPPAFVVILKTAGAHISLLIRRS